MPAWLDWNVDGQINLKTNHVHIQFVFGTAERLRTCGYLFIHTVYMYVILLVISRFQATTKEISDIFVIFTYILHIMYAKYSSVATPVATAPEAAAWPKHM